MDAPIASRLPRRWIALATLGVFLWLDMFHLDLFRQVADDWSGYPRTAALALLGYGPQLLVVFAMAVLLHGPRGAADALGLARSPVAGLLFALAVTALLPLGFALTAQFAPPGRPVLVVLHTAVLPGFGEEILYRAFLFGFLFRYAGWGFLPAALAGAVIFGANHFHQGNGLAESAAIFALTGLGAVWFAWLYVEWKYNLWVPVAFHVLMNAYWSMFAISDNALGPVAANGLRLAVVAVSIVLTLAVARRRGARAIRGHRWLRGDEKRTDEKRAFA